MRSSFTIYQWLYAYGGAQTDTLAHANIIPIRWCLAVCW